MSTITLTPFFSNLDNWPGRLFEATEGTTILAKTAVNFTFRYPATGTDFPNYRVVAQGSGFTYDGDVPIAGNMTVVRIFNELNQVVLTISNLQTNPFGADLSQFYANVFGSLSLDGNAGPGPDGQMAWNHLLAGNDVITGTAGDDNQGLVGFDYGNDTYNMGAGDDQVNGGIGNDTVNGGDGYDRFSFSQTTYNAGGPAFRGVTFNAVTGVALDPWGGTDRFTGIEEFEGSRFNDTFIGSADRDRFSGLRGRDTFDGGADSFDVNGVRTEDRRDEVRYQNDYWQGGTRGIVVNLETVFVNGSIRGTIRDGFGNIDTVIDIERVAGTRFNDTFNGSRMNNQFSGGEGRDTYNGGDGFDTINFSRWFGDTPPVGVVVDLSRATNQIINDGFGNAESVTSIEALNGGDGNDTLKGNAEYNYFEGGDGRDALIGGVGGDGFYWYGDHEFGDGDRIVDFVASVDRVGFGVTEFDGMTTTLTLVNGTAATANVGTFIFNAVNDTLYWDVDGTGATAAVAVVLLTNVASLTADNFELFI